MKWKLVYREAELGEAWKGAFGEREDVEIIGGDILDVPCDAIVSPANSFGFMDGGLDMLLSLRFGWDLQARLQEMVALRPARELLVGEALLVETMDAKIPWLIAAPTMRVPMLLRQSVNPYLAMKAILNIARSEGPRALIESVAIPGLGTGVGEVPARVAAHQMFTAYAEVIHNVAPFPADFSEAQKRHYMLNPDIQIWD